MVLFDSESILEDPEEIKLLIDKVYRFSHIYRKSFRQQKLPVAKLMPQNGCPNRTPFRWC